MSNKVSESAPRGTGIIEVRSIDWVPDSERTAKLWHQAPLWFLGNFQYFSISLGFIGPLMGLSLLWTAVASIIGISIGTLFMAFHASQGPHMGLPQMIQSRAQFGFRGVLVPLLGTLFTYIAFNVADTVLLGQGLKGSFGWDPVAVGIIVTIGAALLAIFGHDWLHKAFRIILYVALPVMIIVTIGILVGAASVNASPMPDLGFNWIAFIAQITACAAYNITYAPYVSDYSRYLPASTKPRAVIASVFFGASTSAIWLIIIGAWLAITLGVTDGLSGIQMAGNSVFAPLGDAAAILMALALAATMGMNAYGGMLTVVTMIHSFSPVKLGRKIRVVVIVALAVVWLLISALINESAIGVVFSALTLMLYVLVPWTSVNLVDYFWVRKGQYAIADLFTPKGVYDSWGRRGLIAFAIGFLAEVPFMIVPPIFDWSYTGPLAQALGGVDIAWAVGLVVSAIVYLALSRSLDLAKEQVAIAQSEETLKHVSFTPIDEEAAGSA